MVIQDVRLDEGGTESADDNRHLVTDFTGHSPLQRERIILNKIGNVRNA